MCPELEHGASGVEAVGRIAWDRASPRQSRQVQWRLSRCRSGESQSGRLNYNLTFLGLAAIIAGGLPPNLISAFCGPTLKLKTPPLKMVGKARPGCCEGFCHDLLRELCKPRTEGALFGNCSYAKATTSPHSKNMSRDFPPGEDCVRTRLPLRKVWFLSIGRVLLVHFSAVEDLRCLNAMRGRFN